MSEPYVLSDLRFAGMRPAPERRSGEKHSTQDSAQPSNKSGGSETDVTSTSPDSYDKLASDKPGEELAPDASIWRLYAEEAKEYDNDLISDRNRNLDTMLLFAGLFSAILTAFLIVSTDMLEQDPGQVSTMLLLRMAQSQWRMETGRPDRFSSPVEIPLFKATTSARWINTLWFMALALSLGSAMMAMLAKEWLSAFTASMPRHPYKYALKRQARLDALVSWHALQIIDFLPSLLNFSLVLFTVGLITHIWLLDRVIAMIIATASATLGIAYITVVVLGAATDACPYRTRVSVYIRVLLERYKSSIWSRRQTPSLPAPNSNTTADDLRALQWLADNARDPTIGDNACQALAGLRSRKVGQWELQVSSSGKKLGAESKQIIRDQHALITLGAQVFERLSNSLNKYPRDLSFSRGTNVARYASAFPVIYYSACECLKHLRQLDNSGIKLSRRWAKLREEMIEHAREFKRSAFEALDAIWNNECPPFTPDAYASLTAAELRLTGSSLDELESSRRISTDEVEKTITSAHTSIDFVSDETFIALFKLRARYSRALCRAAFQLHVHSSGRAPIGNLPLIDMLNAIHALATRAELDSNGAIITHHPQAERSAPTPIAISIAGISGYRVLDPNDIGDEDGLLAGLTTLLGSASVKTLPKLEVAAVNAMAAVGPKLMEQWVQIQRDSTAVGNVVNGYPYEPPSSWPFLSTVGDTRSSAQTRAVNMPRTKCVITQLLEITHFAILHFDHPGICELPDIALESLYSRASTPRSSRHAAHEVILPRIGVLKHWIDSVGRIESEKLRERTWSQFAKTRLLRLLAIQNQEKKTIFDYLLMRMTAKENGAENIRLFIVLEVMGTVPGYVDDIRKLLENVSSCVQDEYTGNYSQCFTSMSDGFHYLQKIGSHLEYAQYVTQAIMKLVIYLAEKSDNSGWVKASAVPGFLDAVSFVCRHPPPQWNKSSNLFIPAVISTLQRLDVRSIAPYLSVQSALDDLKAAAKHMSNRMSRARFLSAHATMEAEIQALTKAVEGLGQDIRGRYQESKTPVTPRSRVSIKN